jgi:hypothetical protein
MCLIGLFRGEVDPCKALYLDGTAQHRYTKIRIFVKGSFKVRY